MQSWTPVYAIADGARIRNRPVWTVPCWEPREGSVLLRLVQTMAHDGYAWGWSLRGGTYGWVRDDLWEEEQFTGPDGGASPKVPWCG